MFSAAVQHVENKTLQGFANIDLQQIDGAFDKAKGSISCQLFFDFHRSSWICLVSHGNLHMTHIALLWTTSSKVPALGDLMVSSNVNSPGRIDCKVFQPWRLWTSDITVAAVFGCRIDTCGWIKTCEIRIHFT